MMRRTLVPCLAIALASAVPAMAQQERPYDEAVAARQAGDHERAKALLAPWVAAHPGDVDARLQLGYARLALGELEAAEADFRAVLAAAPDYRDAEEGLARVAQARADRSDAGSQDRFIIVEGALADLSDNREGWSELALAAVFPAAPSIMIDLRGTHFRRFGLGDSELAAVATNRIGQNSWIRFGASATPDADFRPEWGASAGIDHRIGSGGSASVIGIDLRYQEFPLQNVWTIAPQFTRYFAQGRVSGTVRATGTLVDRGSLEVGGLARLDYMPSERSRLYGGIGHGPDTDLGVVTDTTSLFGGLELPLSKRLSAIAAVSREWRDDGLDRNEGRLGLKVGF